ncbi:MAG: DUF503 domain-containing protein [Desulfuromonadales bacterium]|nr:DUF503 domain-containing protein [Desulfuromonadales bacterium]
MVVGVLRLDLLLEGGQSLKQKRSRVNKVLAKIRSTYPVSAAEVGSHDLWQRALLGICLVSGDEALIHSLFQRLEDDLTCSGLAEIVASDLEILHYGDE